MANCSVYAVSCGCSCQLLKKPVTHNYTLTFGWLHSGLHVWLRCCTRWTKLRLKVFIHFDTVSCPCESIVKRRTLLLSHPNDNKNTKVSGLKSFQRFGYIRIGWSSSKHVYAVLRVLPHSIQTYMHVCIAVLTGSGFSSLSSVFISDGCTPLRLTPYATHRRDCVL